MSSVPSADAAAASMRAVYLERPGDPAGVGTRPVPRPRIEEGEALIRVAAAAVNRSDVLNAEGLPITGYPRVPGRDFAGVVVEGPPGTVGRAYWGSGSGDLGFTRDGSHAEFLAVPADALVQVPSGFSLVEAGAAGLSYAIAAEGLAVAGFQGEGEVVLVTGVAGGVGSAVAAIASWRGATVIGSVLDEDERRAARRATPAAVPVIHGEQTLAEAVEQVTGRPGADIVYDTVGNPAFEEAVAALGRRGRMVVITASRGSQVPLDLFDFYRREARLLTANSTREDSVWMADRLRELMPGFESGALPAPIIAARYSLEECAAAYSAVGEGLKGRVVFSDDRA